MKFLSLLLLQSQIYFLNFVFVSFCLFFQNLSSRCSKLLFPSGSRITVRTTGYKGWHKIELFCVASCGPAGSVRYRRAPCVSGLCKVPQLVARGDCAGPTNPIRSQFTSLRARGPISAQYEVRRAGRRADAHWGLPVLADCSCAQSCAQRRKINLIVR